MTDKTPDSPSLSYRDAGVDIDAANQLIDRIKPIAARTRREGMLSDLGGFGALFEIPAHYRQPVLVSGTDGVGTKLKLAIDTGNHDSIGIDLVAMCVNDLLVQGAEPLFFLDYYATGRLQLDTAESVIKGIGKGCELAGAALIGGETAEMPGLYSEDDYDLAGFCVGVVEKDSIISGADVKPGNVLLGIASSGPHSNGYSLIRKIIDISHADLDSDFDGRTLGEVLLDPTRIYVKPLLKLIKELPVLAMAHITGGGLLENIPRVLPKDVHAVIDTGSWTRLPIFDWLQDTGGVAKAEMYRTFNCGIGMVICVDENDAESALSLLSREGETAWRIGIIEAGCDENEAVILK